MKLKELVNLIKYGGENIVIYSEEYCNRKFKVADIPKHLYNRYVEELGTTHGGDIGVSLYDINYTTLPNSNHLKSDIRRLNELATATIINGKLTKFRYYSDDVYSKDNQLHWKSVTNEEVNKDDLFYLNQLGNVLQVDGDKITLVNWEY